MVSYANAVNMKPCSGVVGRPNGVVRFLHEKLMDAIQRGDGSAAYALAFVLAHHVGWLQRKALAEMDTHGGEQ